MGSSSALVLAHPGHILPHDVQVVLGAAGLDVGVGTNALLERTARVAGATPRGEEADQVSTAIQTTEEAS